MCKRSWILLIFVFLLVIGKQVVASPTQTNSEDTIQTKNNSYPEFITKIHKATVNMNSEWLFKMIFRSEESLNGSTSTIQTSQPLNSFLNNNISQYDGKPIGSIEIIILDPFGYNLDYMHTLDRTPDHWLPSTGNALHIKSKETKIRRMLMFREGDLFDGYKLQESERLLRSYDAIKDVRMRLLENEHEGDTLSLQVIVHDYWSLTPDAELSLTKPEISIMEQNFLGYLHQTGFQYTFHSDSLQGHKGFFNFENILGKYADAGISYGTPLYDRYFGLRLNREFYSPLTKWSYGFENKWITNRNIRFNIEGQGRKNVNLSYRSLEGWVSHSLALDRINPHRKPHQRLIVNMGIKRDDYLHGTELFNDTLRLFFNRELLLAGIGYSSRTFYKDRYIYGFGEYEDVKEGVLLALVGGYDFGPNPFRSYGAIHLATARHLPLIGHIAASLQYGGYIQSKRIEHGVLNLGFSYFGDLYALGNYRIRHFLYTGYVQGIRRQTAESITLSGPHGLYRFNNDNLLGTQKAYANFETILYLPHDILGFNFGVLVFGGGGFIHNEHSPLLRSRLHQVYGLGFLIKNVYLQMNTIRVSFGFYPSRGDDFQSIFQFNPISSYNLRFRELQFNRPYLPDYR